MFRLAVTVALLVALLATAQNPAPVSDAKPVEPFNGKDLTGWKLKGDAARSKWQACAVAHDEKNPTQLVGGVNNSPDGKGSVLAAVSGGGVDIYTEQEFGDCTVEVEFMIPKGSNSGIYLMGEYEVQVFDSYGKTKLGMGDLGAIYSAAAPQVNASKKPGEWQKFVIEFRAPRFEDDKKVANGKFLKVTLNDTVIHENVEVTKSTGGGLTGKERPKGPVMFQGDHGAVAFRNIKITPTVK